MKSLKARFIALAAVVTLVGAGIAFSQVTYNRGTSQSVAGIIVPVSLGADSLIQDGTVVMVDTTTAATTNQKRIVVVPYNGTVLNRYRVIGVAAGPIKKPGNAATGHRGAVGNVLIWGYHPSAKVSSSTQAGNVQIKPAILHGKFAVSADSVGIAIGWLIGPGLNNTASNPRGQVFITNIGARHGLTLN